MKRYILAGLVLFCGAYAKADMARRLPNYLVSEAVYLSSASCAATGVISTFSVTPTFVYGVDITSAGSIGSSFLLYNSSTSIALTNYTVMNSTIDATRAQWHPFNYFASSGVAVYNNAAGGSPACFTVYYQDRK